MQIRCEFDVGCKVDVGSMRGRREDRYESDVNAMRIRCEVDLVARFFGLIACWSRRQRQHELRRWLSERQDETEVSAGGNDGDVDHGHPLDSRAGLHLGAGGEEHIWLGPLGMPWCVSNSWKFACFWHDFLDGCSISASGAGDCNC